MVKEVLITGGAGFIGSHLADELLMHGYRVRVLDNLLPPVHGAPQPAPRPAYLNPNVTLIQGDICDPKAVAVACRGVDAVFHFAARVGVGQSMYEIAQYTEVNNLGAGIAFGLVMGALFALPFAMMPDPVTGQKYFWEILIPGSLVGLIVGYLTQRYGATSGTVSYR